MHLGRNHAIPKQMILPIMENTFGMQGPGPKNAMVVVMFVNILCGACVQNLAL